MKMFFEGAIDLAAKSRYAFEAYRNPAPDACIKQTSVQIKVEDIRTVIEHGEGATEVIVVPPAVLSRVKKYLERHVEAAMAVAVAELEAEAETQLLKGRTLVEGYLEQINAIEAKRAASKPVELNVHRPVDQ